MKRGAVFFDRDGVLNVDKGYVYRIEDLVWRPGAREALRLVKERGLFAFVVTNQSGVGRGFYTEDDVLSLHDHMQQELAGAIDEFRYCPHHPQATLPQYRCECACRKPQPGMILDLLARWPVDRAQSLLVGDKDSDIAAAEAAGLHGLLINDETPLNERLASYI